MMPPPADSLAFQTVLEHWLEETATAEEEAQLWQWVSESAECAREFAAATRFQGMLAEVIKARDVEEEARRVLALAPREREPTRALPRPAPQAQPHPFRLVALAAALALLGVVTVLLWPSPPAASVTEHRAAPAPASTAAPGPPSPVPPAPALELAGPPNPKPSPMSLVEQLDGFFIGPLSMEAMPLGQAMALLRQLLEEKANESTLPLTALHVTVPAGAMGRRVTFHTQTPLPFLKAVRAIAALAGCDVQAQEQTIALILHPSVFPLAVEKKKITDLLAGRLTRDGTPLREDRLRLQALLSDAASLGIVPAQDGTALVSSGQWAALLQLTDSRDYLNSLPLPTFAVYRLPAHLAPSAEAGMLTPEQADDFLNQMNGLGRTPDEIISPRADAQDPSEPLVLIPDGDDFRIALNTTDTPENPTMNLPMNAVGPEVKDPYAIGGSDKITNSLNGDGAGTLSLGNAFVLPDLSLPNTIQVIVPVQTNSPPP